jgi:DNA mismatch repair protein MutH
LFVDKCNEQGQRMHLPYDPTDRESVIRYAENLVGKSLREVLDTDPQKLEFTVNKGGWGTTLEREYFKYQPNSRPEPDFAEAGLELKATPVKETRTGLQSKERLVLGMIDYMTITEETWEASSFLKKNSSLLLVFYLHEQGRDPEDFIVQKVVPWEFSEEDLAIIRQDWELIVDKVRRGQAHEISEGDTLFLGACVKAAKSTDRRPQPFGPPAKPRAWALRASYMSALFSGAPNTRPVADADDLAEMTFEQLVSRRFDPFIGWRADDIAAKLEIRTSPRPKSFYANITNRILGLADEEQSAEIRKAGITVKTMRILPSGRPKEDISFPAFKYAELVEQDWESSDLRADLSRRFMFVIYQLDRDDVPTLEGVRFWTMPVDDLDTYARECFDRTVSLIREDRADYLPKKSENRAVHVRPHGRDSRDTYPTPSGRMVCKKSFWLNGTYVRDQLGLR